MNEVFLTFSSSLWSNRGHARSRGRVPCRVSWYPYGVFSPRQVGTLWRTRFWRVENFKRKYKLPRQNGQLLRNIYDVLWSDNGNYRRLSRFFEFNFDSANNLHNYKAKEYLLWNSGLVISFCKWSCFFSVYKNPVQFVVVRQLSSG